MSVAPARIFLSPPHIDGKEQAYVAEAFASNYVAPVGPMLNAFEAELAEVTGIPHCLALTSGTAALHLALRLIEAGPGDAIWAPSLTFLGGISSVLFQGATPVFFDSDAHTLIDLDLVEAELKAGGRPKALIVTDLYGMAVDMGRARALADAYGFTLIADTAEGLGSRHNGAHAGKGADFVILSFNGNKIITTSGGGALLSEDGTAIKRARYLSEQAKQPLPYYEHTEVGYNYRLSNISAAIGRGQLERLPAKVARRRAVFEAYRAGLGNLPGVSLLEEPTGNVANRWLSVVFFDPAITGLTPEEMRLALEAENIESRPVWKPMHLQPLFKGTRRMIGGAVSERLFARGLCLPSGTAMTDADLERIIGLMRQRLARA
jgi:pyridoxal phosphate-dependent aminotransferase EpsN